MPRQYTIRKNPFDTGKGNILNPTMRTKIDGREVVYFTSQTKYQHKQGTQSLTVPGTIVRGPYIERGREVVDVEPIRDPSIKSAIVDRFNPRPEFIDFWDE